MFPLFRRKEERSAGKVNVSALPADALAAPADARMFPIEEVKDEMFSRKMLGDGVAFELRQNRILSPAAGELTVLFPTGHAFGVRRDDGLEVLIHIGIDTVELGGKGFKVLVKQGDRVRAGDPVVEVDLALVRKAGFDPTVMLILTGGDTASVRFSEYGEVKAGSQITL